MDVLLAGGNFCGNVYSFMHAECFANYCTNAWLSIFGEKCRLS